MSVLRYLHLSDYHLFLLLCKLIQLGILFHGNDHRVSVDDFAQMASKNLRKSLASDRQACGLLNRLYRRRSTNAIQQRLLPEKISVPHIPQQNTVFGNANLTFLDDIEIIPLIPLNYNLLLGLKRATDQRANKQVFLVVVQDFEDHNTANKLCGVSVGLIGYVLDSFFEASSVYCPHFARNYGSYRRRTQGVVKHCDFSEAFTCCKFFDAVAVYN
jgi:hypothetical protein